MPGLVNGLGYTFAVVANGTAGPSAASTPSNTIVPDVPVGPSAGVLQAPVGVTATGEDRQVTVRWTAAPDGATASRFTATATPGGATCTTTGITCVITGLTNGRAYVITVVGHADPGDGVADSGPSAPTGAVYPGVATQPPTSVYTVGRDSGLLVRWHPPVDAGTGNCHFTATTADNGRCATVNGSIDQCMMFVPIGNDYQVRVVAHGLYGHDSPSVLAYNRRSRV
ncbi:hypothetical protein [Dactylosporangium sp. NPDC005555]|uniref:hypothetical protein n=1 Tax=Dactylosporangium sp. NPDC005555 TaxID=3154889 RepID=UPI0033BD6E02